MCFSVLDACLQLENYDEWTDMAVVRETVWAYALIICFPGG